MSVSETRDETRPSLFALGFLGLFLELALIRFLAGSIWNLGYFPNIVLIAVFIGMGGGFVLHHRWGDQLSGTLFASAPWALWALVALVSLFHPAVPGFEGWQADFDGDLYFTAVSPEVNASDTRGLLLFVVWFLSVVLIFFLISQRTAKVFRSFRPIEAYTLDISGSCAGVLSFMVVSWLQAPAWTWFLVATALFFMTAPRDRRRASGLLWVLPLASTVVIAWIGDTRLTSDPAFPGTLEVVWSPYQKLEYAEWQGAGVVLVNGVNHQGVVRVGAPESYYSIPYEARAAETAHPPYRNVLVLGAGTGNDVAAALAAGALHVDAVEIDPGIARFGRDHHPDHPYGDARVDLHITDGRAFLSQSDDRYDLIVFALTDSLVKVSPMTQLRLENYLFTQESISRAASLLAPDGDLLFYNFYRQPWLEAKLLAMIRDATGGAVPRELFRRDDFVMIAASVSAPTAPPAEDTQGSFDVARDDWPFLYLRERGVPVLYLVAIGAVAVLVILMIAFLRRRPSALGGGAPLPVAIAFLSMGMAFLLLETKSTIQFSLLFGTTWVTSSLVFLGVLALVLAANLTATYRRLHRPGPIYASLFVSSLITLVVPLSALLRIENLAVRFVLASLITFAPIFFANLIFSIAFRDQALPEHVFGWNLIGATLGGLLEYSSMAIGYTNLSLVVVACYGIVFLGLRRSSRPQPLPEDRGG